MERRLQAMLQSAACRECYGAPPAGNVTERRLQTMLWSATCRQCYRALPADNAMEHRLQTMLWSAACRQCNGAPPAGNVMERCLQAMLWRATCRQSYGVLPAGNVTECHLQAMLRSAACSQCYGALPAQEISLRNHIHISNQKMLYLFPVNYLYSGFHIWKMIGCGQNGLSFVLFMQFSMRSSSWCKRSRIHKSFCGRDDTVYVTVSRY